MANCCWNRWKLRGPQDDIDMIEKWLRGAPKSANEGVEMTFDTLRPMPALLTHIATGKMTIDGVKQTQWYHEDAPQEPGEPHRGGIDRVLDNAEKAELRRIESSSGCSTAYDWRTRYWGSSRDAHDTTKIRRAGELVLTFVTAWAPPEPIAQLIRRRWLRVRLTGDWEVDGGLGRGAI